MALAAERQKLIGLMAGTVESQARIGNWRYAFWRPQNVQYTATQLVTSEVDVDCSDGCRALCYAAGVKDDPAGNGYQSWGNSSSIWAHLHHTGLADAEPGDIGTFGKWSGEEHALMFWEKYGPGLYDWNVWNHGRQGEPHKASLMVEIAGHSGQTLTVCRLNVTDPPLTPQDKLRAATGFYSWLSWYQGWNAWKHYGPRNKAVRPKVPVVIWPVWWARRKQFLANQHKGNGEG